MIFDLSGTLEGGDWSAHYLDTRPYDDEDTVPEEMLAAFHVHNITQKDMFIKVIIRHFQGEKYYFHTLTMSLQVLGWTSGILQVDFL